MTDEPTTGISNPDRPDHWLVPPWPDDAAFSDVIRHFLRFHPWRAASSAHLVAYFEGYAAALDAAPADEVVSEFHRRWCADMRDCVERCARGYRDMHTELTGTVSALRTAARVSPHGERAS